MIWIATDFLFIVVPFDTVIKEGMVGSGWIDIDDNDVKYPK